MLGGRVEDAAPERARRHPRAPRRRGDQASLRRARHRADRPRDRQPLPVRARRRRSATSSEGDVVETIDIGGPGDAARRREELRRRRGARRPGALRLRARRAARAAGDLSLDTRRELAAEAFAHTAGYDIAIANWFSDTRVVPRAPSRRARQGAPTSPTARTRTSAPPTTRSAAPAATCSRWSTSTAASSSRSTTCSTSTPRRRWCSEFTVPACVIVKHANPCGVAVAATIEEAYRKALAADPVVGVRRRGRAQPPVTRALAELSPSSSSRCCSRPATARAPSTLLREKPQNLRLLESDERRRPTPGERDFQRVLGGCWSRIATPSPRIATRWRSSRGAAPDRARVGRPALRLARRQARALERDRDRARHRHDRHRRRPDAPRRRDAGSRSTRRSRRSPARCSPPTRSSRSPTASRRRSRPACA